MNTYLRGLLGRITPRSLARTALFGGTLLSVSVLLHGQAAPAAPAAPVAATDKGPKVEEETVVLSPFVVDATKDRGYQATSTLAGTRIRTDLSDVGSAISVITPEMLKDLGATNNESVLAYAVNTEVGGARGNFSGGVKSGTYREEGLFVNPNGNTRVRGLTSADNTRNYFLTDIPWDGYTVSRVDLLRGPNAILFGLGSPAGVVNATTNTAMFTNKGSVGVTFDKFGSRRYTIDYNQQLLPGELALRVAVLKNNEKFQQKPAFSDDDRVYGAVQYNPKFLNKESMRFEISGNFEHGNILSNRPRVVTPGDLFTPFWDPESQGGTGKKTYNYLTQRLGTVGDPNYTQVLSGAGLGDIVHLINSKSNVDWIKNGVDAYRAIRPDGTFSTNLNDNEFGPFPRTNSLNRVGIRPFNEWAGALGKPFSSFGAYVPKTITDPSVFDFYHKLIDGPNKREWTDWNVFNLDLTNTFLNDTVGYNISYFKQRLNNGQWGALGWTNTIFMDINDVNGDGAPNPDVGRGYVQIEDRDGGNNATDSNRDAWRAQVFGEYDFAKKHDGLWSRIAGLHRLTGVLSQENQHSDSRAFRNAFLDPVTQAQFTPSTKIEGADNGNGVSTGFRYYLSGDLRAKSSAAGSNLSNMEMPFLPSLGGPITIRRFDNTWTAGAGVDPAATWANPSDPTGTYTQSNNPANYRGWSNVQANLITPFTKGTVAGMSAQDYLTSSGTLVDYGVDSNVAVWQGYFWDKSIVGTYGYRKDKARSYQYISADRNATGRTDTGGANLDPSSYNFSNPKGTVTELNTTTRNWSVAMHLNKLLGKRDFLPINVSVYYNKGENFQPLAGRIDAFAQPLAAPGGTTTEKSVLLATKDGKYSLRATQYDTIVTNASSTGSIGNMWALEQVLYFTADLARDFKTGAAAYSDYGNSGGDVNKLQNVILPAWFKTEADLKAQFPAFVNAWFRPGTSFGTSNLAHVNGSGAPAGFAFTEDSHSKGYEFDFTANPTPNWRVAVNASKTEAVRTQVPGVAFKAVADFMENAMQNTDAGLAPIWWSGNIFGGRNVGPWSAFRPDYLRLNALNGQSQGEVRKWRANLMTNYYFSQGRLKGFGAGSGYRWEDKAVIGYAPMKTAKGDDAINLNAPFYAPGDNSLDLWISYEHKIAKDVNWRIQLNVYNVGGKNELIPFSASVDYEKLASITTITPTTVIPMKGSAFTIRQGMSWQLSNTFEF